MDRRRAGAWRPREAPPPFDPGAHSLSILERALGAWQSLYDDERDSVIAASLVMRDLAKLGAPANVLGLAARVVEDEVRHVEVCATVVRALGGEPRAKEPAATRSALGPGATLEAQLAGALVAGFTVGEAMSAAGFAVARRSATEPLVRWALTELLRDEARHGAFGAEAGAWVVQGWSPEARRSLWPACVREMEAMEQRIGGPLSDAERASEPSRADLPALEAFGMVRRSRLVEAMLAAIPRWVLPKLDALGVLPDKPREAPVTRVPPTR